MGAPEDRAAVDVLRDHLGVVLSFVAVVLVLVKVVRVSHGRAEVAAAVLQSLDVPSTINLVLLAVVPYALVTVAAWGVVLFVHHRLYTGRFDSGWRLALLLVAAPVAALTAPWWTLPLAILPWLTVELIMLPGVARRAHEVRRESDRDTAAVAEIERAVGRAVATQDHTEDQLHKDVLGLIAKHNTDRRMQAGSLLRLSEGSSLAAGVALSLSFVVLFVSAASSSVWLPPERLEMPGGGRPAVGYVLGQSGDSFAVLLEKPRTVEYIPVAGTARSLCDLRDDNRDRTLLEVALRRRSAQADLPDC